MGIHKPALLIYSFGAKDSPGDRDFAYLRQAWERCRAQKPIGLGLVSQARGLSLSVDFPSTTDASNHQFHVLAGAQLSVAAKDCAFGFEYLDVLGICVCLSPEDGRTRWRALLRDWEASWLEPRGNDTPTFGEIVLFCGLYESGALEELPESLERELPAECQFSRNSNRVDLGEGLYLWEASTMHGRRILVVLAPESNDWEMTQRLFWKNATDLPAFPRFLMHSAKASYHMKVYAREAPTLHARQKESDEGLQKLDRLQKAHNAGVLNADLLSAQRELIRGEADSAGLILSISLLRELKQSVEIARRNLTTQIPSGEMKVAFWREPIEQCLWLRQQLDAELTYLRAARDRARGMFRITILRIAEAREANARRQHRMDLTQTILLGALLVSLDAMHAFHAELPLDERFKWPLISLLMALTFALPPLLLNWRDLYGRLEQIAGALFGGAIAWLLLTIFRDQIEELKHPAIGVIGTVALCCSVSLGAIALSRRIQLSRRSVVLVPDL